MRVTMVCNDGGLPTVDSLSDRDSCRSVKADFQVRGCG